MTKNLKKDYLMKLAAIRTKNGYKCDVANYVYNPAYGYEYPNFVKILEENEEKKVVSRIYFFRHYDGRAEIKERIYDVSKAEGSWVIERNAKTTVLAELGKARFSLNQLISYC